MGERDGQIPVFREQVIGVGCVGWIEKRSSAQREGDWSQGTGQAGADEGGWGWPRTEQLPQNFHWSLPLDILKQFFKQKFQSYIMLQKIFQS